MSAPNPPANRQVADTVRVITWERTPTVEEMANMEAGRCVCPCGASVVITADDWARCEHSEGHEFCLTSVNGEPVLVYRWNSERDLNDHIRTHNQRKESLGFNHDCELHRSLDGAHIDGSLANIESTDE